MIQYTHNRKINQKSFMNDEPFNACTCLSTYMPNGREKNSHLRQ